MRKCNNCNLELSDDSFDGNRKTCKKCRESLRDKTKQKTRMKGYNEQYRKDHTEDIQKHANKRKGYQRQWRRYHATDRKLFVLANYGGKCACCGETEPDCLAMDHINNDGAEHRKQFTKPGASRSGSQINGKAIYSWLIENNFPTTFQILCFNCNFSKSIPSNHGKCIHQIKREAEKAKGPIIISNHVTSIGFPIPQHYIIRINLAWIKSPEEFDKIIYDLYDHKFFIDYPLNRHKPPTPTMSMDDAIEICNLYHRCATYFAFSNAEDTTLIKDIRSKVNKLVKLVPKIETKTGVDNLLDIVKAAETDTLMLDKEDLYVDCDADPAAFNACVDKVRQSCKDLGITCLELQGVVFGD